MHEDPVALLQVAFKTAGIYENVDNPFGGASLGRQ